LRGRRGGATKIILKLRGDAYRNGGEELANPSKKREGFEREVHFLKGLGEKVVGARVRGSGAKKVTGGKGGVACNS